MALLFRTAECTACQGGRNAVLRHAGSGFSSEIRRGTFLACLSAGGDVARLRPGPRAVFGEKLLDLANFAAAALVFGQFVGQEPLSLTIIVAGVMIWIVIVLTALWLMGAWRWKTLSGS